MKTPKPKELSQEEIFNLMKELEGLEFPTFLDDYKAELQEKIDKQPLEQLEIPFL